MSLLYKSFVKCKVQTDQNIGRIGLIKVGNHGILFNKGIADSCFLGGLIGVATAKKDGLMPMEQFFDRDVNPIEDYNTFTWNGIRKTTKSTSNSPFESGDGQNAVIFIGTNDVQKIGFQATYSGQLIKIRLYWVGSWGKWQTFSLT